MTRDDLKKLFPDLKFPTAKELKAKEDSFSIGDRVKVSDNIRCRQKGKTGTIVQIDPEDKHNWKTFIVKFDDKKYNSMGFQSGDIDKLVEKKASREQYISGSGKVESYKKDKTKGHDEIVLRLKDGRRVVISNNTKLGIRVEPKEGDEVNYHGYGVKGTNVIHKVHSNRSSRGGWLEHVKKAASNKDFDDIVKAYKDRYGVDLSHMTMRWSKHPVYNNGERSYEFGDDETGGSWVSDSTIRINPNMGPVMKRFGIEGMTQREFRKRLIAHELAHEIWRKQREERKDLIKAMLAKAKEEKFTTPYLPTVPKQKLDEETFAEYMSDQLNKKAESNDDILAMARKHYPDEGSHGWNHIEDVMTNARRMRRRELLKKELAALAYHDSSLMTGSRKTHAEDSAAIAGEELRKLFRKEQLKDIMNAIAHHRASYKGHRASRLEDLVAAADRNIPDVEKTILRSYKYGLENGMGPEGAIANTLQHMPDKYGTKGYAYKNIPKIYMDTYGDELRKAQEEFDNVTPERIKALAEKELGKTAQAFSEDGRTFTLSQGQSPGVAVSAWNKAHPDRRITWGQIQAANGGLADTRFRAGVAYAMPESAWASAGAPQEPVAENAHTEVKEQPVKDPVSGRVYYVNFPDHKIGLTGVTGGGGRSAWDRGVSWVKDKTGWDGKARLGHAGILFRDANGRTKYYEYGRYSDGNVGYSSKANDGYFGNFRNIKVPDFGDMSDDEYIKRLAAVFPGEPSIEMHGADAPDIEAAQKYILDTANDRNRKPYSVGGYNCGSMARRAFDIARGWDNWAGKTFDWLGGFTPGRNAPTFMASKTTFRR